MERDDGHAVNVADLSKENRIGILCGAHTDVMYGSGGKNNNRRIAVWHIVHTTKIKHDLGQKRYMCSCIKYWLSSHEMSMESVCYTAAPLKRHKTFCHVIEKVSTRRSKINSQLHNGTIYNGAIFLS